MGSRQVKCVEGAHSSSSLSKGVVSLSKGVVVVVWMRAEGTPF